MGLKVLPPTLRKNNRYLTVDIKITSQITKDNLVSIVWENVDLEKMKAMFSSSEDKAAEAAHTVIQPVEIYIEVEGGK